MSFNLSELAKTKTFWVSVAGVITAIGSLVAGEMSTAEFIQTVLLACLGTTGRAAMLKGGKVRKE